MININPFKKISDIENGIAEFKKMDIINAIGVIFMIYGIKKIDNFRNGGL